jgi:DNA-directed RNA polymerase subunit RPC12/RpoP
MAEKKTTNNSVWEKLSRIDCSEHTEKKQDLTYLSWAWAWGVLKEAYPQASYQVREWNGIPYLHDPYLGYLVETSVTIEGETLTMRLPVMNSSNKAMKHEPYEIVYKPKNKQPYTVAVEAATMFDINTAIMRCLVKNLAMFGLGLYIYAGEDLPEDIKEYICTDCGKTVDPNMAKRTEKAFGTILCKECGVKRKEKEND